MITNQSGIYTSSSGENITGHYKVSKIKAAGRWNQKKILLENKIVELLMTEEWQKMRRYDGIMVLMANLQPIINGYYINGGTYTYTGTYLNRTDYCF